MLQHYTSDAEASREKTYDRAYFADHAADLSRIGFSTFPLIERKPILSRKKGEVPTNWGCASGEATVRARFAMVPRADGIGIATGANSSVFVVDVDTLAGHSADGSATLAELERIHTPLPATVEAVTPTGGRHLYFRHVTGIKNSAGRVGVGLDIRGEGGFTVAPPSMRPGRGVYKWINSPFDHEIAEAPDWLIFAAMFHKERKLLARLGIHTADDLAGTHIDHWRAHVDKLIAADTEEQARIRAEKAVQRRHDRAANVSVDERARVDGLAWQLLDDIAADLSTAPTGGRNTYLSSQAAKAGMLAGHPETRSQITESVILDRLMAATSGWGEGHPESRRRPTIERGIAEGVAMAQAGQCGWLDAAIARAMRRLETVESTDEPDNHVDHLPVDTARHELSRAIADLIAEAKRWNEQPDDFGNVVQMHGPAWLVEAGTGLGKTEAAIKVAANYRAEAVLGGGIVHFVPTHRLCDEVAGRYREAGFHNVAVRRGRGADDPDQPKKRMCHKHELAELCAKAGQSVARVMCDSSGLLGAPCEFRDQCGYRKQFCEEADIYAVPHAVMSSEIAEGLPDKPWLVVADETFAGKHVTPARRKGRGEDRGLYLTKADFIRAPALRKAKSDEPDDYATNDLEAFRASLGRCIAACAGGYLTGEALRGQGLDYDKALAALRLEERAERQAAQIAPADGDPATYAEALATHTEPHSAWIRAWKEIKWLLSDRYADYGGQDRFLYCSQHGDLLIGEVRQVAGRWQDKVPVIALDATPPTDEEMRQTLAMGARHVAGIHATAPHQTTELIVGAPTSKSALAKQSNVKAVCRAMWRDLLAHDYDPARVLVVTHKAAVEAVKAHLPEGVTVHHYGSLAGLDAFGDFQAAYLVGAPLMPADEAEAIAEVLHQVDIPHRELERLPRVVGTRDGKRFAVEEWRHPDPRVDEIMIANRDRELIQAAGRLRGVNRTAESPCRLVIVADVVLPLDVDTVTPWHDWAATPLDVMQTGEFLPRGRKAMMRFWPRLFEGEKEARGWADVAENLFGPSGGHSLVLGSREAKGHRLAHIRIEGESRGVGDWIEAIVAAKDIAAHILKVTEIAVEVRTDRPASVAAVMERHGFCPLSRRHAHRLAPDIWSTPDAAKRDLKRLQPQGGEHLVTYRLAGRGRQQEARAVAREGVRATDIEAAFGCHEG